MLFSVLSVPAFAAAPEESADPALTTEQTAAEEENCFFTSSSTEEEKEPNSITYVALGDSICAGIGLTTVQYAHNLMGVDVSFNFKGYPEACYVGQVGKSLNLDRDHAINLGLPGVMSKDMLELVKTGTMAEMNTLSGCQYNYPEFVDYIKSADVISIQLGSNDAFVPTVVSFGEATNWKSEDLASIVLSGNLRGSSKETEDALNESLKKLSLTRSEKDAVWNQMCIRDREMDVLVMAAAVADYRPVTVASDKIKKKDGDLSIPVAVSYTHLDVYKRQAQIQKEICDDLFVLAEDWDAELLLSIVTRAEGLCVQ